MSKDDDQIRYWDWQVYDDITGFKVWASETVELRPETSFGGLRTTKWKHYGTDWGAIPYEVKVEQPVPWTRINHQTQGTVSVFNTETQDPMSTDSVD